MHFGKDFIHSIENENETDDIEIDGLIKSFNENSIIKNNNKEEEFWKLIRLMNMLEDVLSDDAIKIHPELSEELSNTFKEYSKFFKIILSGPCPNEEEVNIAKFIEKICTDGFYMSTYDYYCNCYFILSSIRKRLERLEREEMLEMYETN